jgi:hypothetical protein
MRNTCGQGVSGTTWLSEFRFGPFKLEAVSVNSKKISEFSRCMTTVSNTGTETWVADFNGPYSLALIYDSFHVLANTEHEQPLFAFKRLDD